MSARTSMLAVCVVRYHGQLGMIEDKYDHGVELQFPATFQCHRLGEVSKAARRQVYKELGVVPTTVISLGVIHESDEPRVKIRIVLYDHCRDRDSSRPEDRDLPKAYPPEDLRWVWEQGFGGEKGLDDLEREGKLNNAQTLAVLHRLELHDRRPMADLPPPRSCKPECEYHSGK